MQSTYAKAARYFAAVLLPLAAAGEDDAGVVVVLEPTLATPDEGDPPHAELVRPTPARTSTNTHSWRRPSVIGVVIAFTSTEALVRDRRFHRGNRCDRDAPFCRGRLTVPLGSGV